MTSQGAERISGGLVVRWAQEQRRIDAILDEPEMRAYRESVEREESPLFALYRDRAKDVDELRSLLHGDRERP